MEFNLVGLHGVARKQRTWIARVTPQMFYLMKAAALLVYFVPEIVSWLPK